jgi:tetratricopeptide (TPR) repeat protein
MNRGQWANERISRWNFTNLHSGKWVWMVAWALSIAACSRSPEKYLASGDKYFKAGKYDEAILQYRNAVQLNSKLAKAHYQLALAYLAKHSDGNAYKELQQTVDLDPGNTEAQLQFASMLIAGKKFDEARAAAQRVLAADPRNARAHAILGDRLAVTGDWNGAIEEYRTAIKLDVRRVESYFALAQVYMSQAQLSAAEAVYKQACDSNPQSSLARVSLGRFYLSQRKFAQGEAELSTASRLSPRDPLPRLMLADTYVAEGNLAEAERVCAQLKAVAPDDPPAYRALAVFFRATRQREKAATELQSLSSSKPKDMWVKGYLAEALLDLNRVKEASAPTQELLSADGNDPFALLLKGRILIAEHKYAEARSVLEKSTKGAAQSADSYYYLGVAQNLLGMTDAAKASIAQARKLSPRTLAPAIASAELEANRGHYEEAAQLAQTNPNVPIAEAVGARSELAKGNLRKAEDMVQAELDLDPASLPALEVLVDAYVRDGKTQEAARRLSSLVSEHPKDAGLQFLLARVYLHQRDFPKAEAGARQTLLLDPQAPDAHAMLGTIASARGLKDQAVNEFKAEIDAHPNSTKNYRALAALYDADGKWQEQISTLEKARTVDPGSPNVKNDLAYLYLEHGGDLNFALSLAQEAKKASPDSPVSSDTLGWAFYKIGSYESAITQLSMATQKVPNKAVYQYHLGMAYLGAGRLEPAVQSLQKALKIDPKFAEAGKAKEALDTIARQSKK